MKTTAVPSAHAEAVTKTSVVTESAKHCLERAIRMRESLSNFRTSWFIFIAKARLLKFSYVFHFFTCSCSKMRRGGCSLTSTLNLISKLPKDCSTRISRVATASSRAKNLDFSEPTPLKQHLKLLFHKSHRNRLSWNSPFNNNSRRNYIWGEKTFPATET